MVTVEDGRRGAVSDSAGRYRIREVRSGIYTLRAVLIGYTPAQRREPRRAGQWHPGA